MRGLRSASAIVATALVPCVAAVAAVPSRGHFVGATSGQGKTIRYQQDRSLRFEVARGAVRGVKVGFKAKCPSGGVIEYEATPLSGTFRVRGGRFTGTGRFADGGTGTVTGRFLTAHRATGTLRMRPVSSDEGVEGSPTETCDSGRLKWTAHLR